MPALSRHPAHIRFWSEPSAGWIPAFAGMTALGYRFFLTTNSVQIIKIDADEIIPVP
jgi:hypothetical protein